MCLAQTKILKYCTLSNKHLEKYINENPIQDIINKTENYKGAIEIFKLPACFKLKSTKGYTKLIHIRCIDDRINIAHKLNNTLLENALLLQKVNKTLCDDPNFKTMSLLCEWSEPVTEVLGYIGKLMYDQPSSNIKLVDMKDSYFAFNPVDPPEPLFNMSISNILPRSYQSVQSLKDILLKRKHVGHFASKIHSFFSEKIEKVTKRTFWDNLDFEHYSSKIQNSRTYQFFETSKMVMTNIITKIPEKTHEVIIKISNELPIIKNKVESMLLFYHDLNNKKISHENHTIFNQLMHKINLFAENDYRQTSMYYYHLGLIKNTTHHRWTGFDDNTRYIDPSRLADIGNYTLSELCWFFRQNCMNSTGCNLGIPFFTIEDGVKCFYPIMKTIPVDKKPWAAGLDPNNLQCKPYWSIPAWTLGAFHLLYHYTYKFFKSRVGVWPGFGWIVDNFTVEIPPNLVWCVIFSFVEAVYIIIIAATVIQLTWILFDIYENIKKIIEQKDNVVEIVKYVKENKTEKQKPTLSSIRTKFKF